MMLKRTDDEHPCLSPSLKWMLLTFQLSMFYFFPRMTCPQIEIFSISSLLIVSFFKNIYLFTFVESLLQLAGSSSTHSRSFAAQTLYLWCVGLIALWHVGS